MARIILVATICVFGAGLAGCVAVAAAGGGYLVGDEVHENDGKFDPLEDVRGKNDGDN